MESKVLVRSAFSGPTSGEITLSIEGEAARIIQKLAFDQATREDRLTEKRKILEQTLMVIIHDGLSTKLDQRSW